MKYLQLVKAIESASQQLLGRAAAVVNQALAGTIQIEMRNTVWRACGDETKTSSRASTGGGPNGAPAN